MTLSLPYTRNARAIALFAARHGVLALLLAMILHAVLAPSIWGARPTPTSPPDGYVSPDLSVRLSWSRGDSGDPLRLEVARDRGFRTPDVTEEVRGSSVTLRPLERGRTYYWRLEPGGVVAMFRTSAHGIHF